MFSKKITDSDAFIEMSSATQALYFHLNQAADDDGFNNQIQVAMMKSHASADDLKVLLMKKFIIRFESGVIVIKHWRIHNTLRTDRYTPTSFQDELAQLNIKDNKAYTLTDTIGCQVVAKLETQYSIDKYSIDKSSKDICVASSTDIPKKSSKFIPPTVDEVKAYCKERNNTIDAEKFIDHYAAANWFRGKTKIKDWKACVRTWEKNDKGKPTTYQNQQKPSQRNNFEQREYNDDYYNDFFTNTK